MLEQHRRWGENGTLLLPALSTTVSLVLLMEVVISEPTLQVLHFLLEGHLILLEMKPSTTVSSASLRMELELWTAALYSRGLWTHPCGTPVLRLMVPDTQLSILTNPSVVTSYRKWRKQEHSLIYHQWCFWHNLCLCVSVKGKKHWRQFSTSILFGFKCLNSGKKGRQILRITFKQTSMNLVTKP